MEKLPKDWKSEKSRLPLTSLDHFQCTQHDFFQCDMMGYEWDMNLITMGYQWVAFPRWCWICPCCTCGTSNSATGQWRTSAAFPDEESLDDGFVMDYNGLDTRIRICEGGPNYDVWRIWSSIMENTIFTLRWFFSILGLTHLTSFNTIAMGNFHWRREDWPLANSFVYRELWPVQRHGL